MLELGYVRLCKVVRAPFGQFSKEIPKGVETGIDPTDSSFCFTALEFRVTYIA